MLRYLFSKENDNICKSLYNLSSKLVDDNFRRDADILKLRYPKNGSFWKSIDLMKMMAFDRMGVSLKQVAINLKWPKIQDIPIEPSQPVNKNQLDLIVKYNLNDVDITIALYNALKEKIEFRRELSELYGIDFSSASDSRIANLIIEKVFAEETHADMEKVKTLRTPCKKVLLGDCIASYISFETPVLKELYDRISSTYVYDYNKYRYSENIYFANCKFSLGIGGLHSEDKAGIFLSDDNYLIQDMDVSSYYPNIIINNNFYPSHLGPAFIDILKKLTKERIEAKEKGYKVKSEALKITINSLFGKLGADTFWLYDPKKMISTTITGQLGLLMLIEKLDLAGIQVISANTDGIICKIDRGLLDKYYEIAKQWEKLTNLNLEFTPYKLYVRRDVNSYIAVSYPEEKVKEKGVFMTDIDLKKAYRMPIVPKALREYFVNGIPVMETIEKSKDIMDFCISQKAGSNFIMELHETTGITTLQKTNRFYVSNSGGAIMKRDKQTGKLIGLYVGNTVRLLNDYDPDIPFEKYDVNFAFYYEEIMKIINEIEPNQRPLFELDDFSGNGLLIKKASEGANKFNVEENTAKNLNKLGKNQLNKQVSNIVSSLGRIPDISGRYIYITEFNHKDMEIEFYCLKKGTYERIYVDRNAYKETQLFPGQIVYCIEFGVKDNRHILKKYKIVEKFDVENEVEKALIDFGE